MNPMNEQSPKSVRDALAFIGSYIETAALPMRMALSMSHGHVLAEDIRAPVSLPRFDNAAMDGFAIREADLSPDGTTRLRLAQTIAAGEASIRELQPGEAARIMTGARLPPGADRVIVQEAAQLCGNEVCLTATPTAKPHIRRTGDDVARGTVVLETGTRIGPGQAALLTALGLRSVLVMPRPKVALLSTGDELIDSPGFLEPGHIYDTNRPMLAQMLKATGAEVTDLGIARDDPETILARLVEAAGSHDLLISSGGASAGFADHLTQVIARRGYLEFWRLDMRPGKPIGFGDVDGCPILLLPGNPLAAAAGFALLGRSIVARLEGRTVDAAQVRCLPVSRALSRPAGRTQVLLGRLGKDPATGMTVVEPLPDQGSASLRYLALADVMIVLHPGQAEIGAGDAVEVLPVWQGFLGQ